MDLEPYISIKGKVVKNGYAERIEGEPVSWDSDLNYVYFEIYCHNLPRSKNKKYKVSDILFGVRIQFKANKTVEGLYANAPGLASKTLDELTDLTGEDWYNKLEQMGKEIFIKNQNGKKFKFTMGL